MSVRINPSILAADYANLERELSRISSADAVHVDIMDAHFVPNLTFGLGVAERLLEVTSLALDVHLMIDDPLEWGPRYAAAGAQSVTFHVESTDDPGAVIDAIAREGAEVAFSVKPGTPIEPWFELLDRVQMVLVMTVEPGFGGQAFMPEMLTKVRALRDEIDRRGLDVRIEVDGGIDERTIALAARAGADTFVAGSSVFRGEPAERIRVLREAAGA